jgi:replicative DNA helicase
MAMADFNRNPPHSLEAEQALLGGLMLVPTAWDRIAGLVNERDFYRRDNQLIFRAIGELAERGEPFDPITLGDWFDSHDLSKDIGGSVALIDLANNTPSAANVEAYARVIRDRSVLRQLIDASSLTARDCFNPEGRTTEAILNEAESRVFSIADSGARGRKGFASTREIAREAVRIMHDRYESKGGLSGLASGFKDFDELTSGLQDGDLVVLAGRPSMGKSAMATNIAEFVALKTKRAVGLFSMEMPASQLFLRMVSSTARIDSQALRSGNLSEEQWPRFTGAVTVLSDAPLHIDETGSLSPSELTSRARRLHREHGLGLVVVDYLQLMQVPGTRENRATEISEISRSLKSLAKELNVPVIALSQLNRALEQRSDKRPMMADLRESGAIEQDADLIGFIYRDEYYNKDSADKGLAELIIAKQRNGPTGTIKLVFDGRHTRFNDYSPETDYPSGY